MSRGKKVNSAGNHWDTGQRLLYIRIGSLVVVLPPSRELGSTIPERLRTEGGTGLSLALTKVKTRPDCTRRIASSRRTDYSRRGKVSVTLSGGQIVRADHHDSREQREADVSECEGPPLPPTGVVHLHGSLISIGG